MHAVVVEREADQQRIHPQHALEVGDDRDRAAGADRHRLVAPFLGQHGARLVERRIVERELQRRRQAEIAELDLAVGRQARAHEGAEAVADFLGVLLADQAERDFRRGLPGDDGLGALAGIAADDAVDLGGRPRGDLLDQHAALLAGRRLQPDRPEEFLRREVERLAGRP